MVQSLARNDRAQLTGLQTGTGASFLKIGDLSLRRPTHHPRRQQRQLTILQSQMMQAASSTWTQTFSYDSVNRLLSAAEMLPIT